MDSLRDFPEGAAFLAEVYDEADTAALRPADALLDRVDEIRLACADIGTEDVRTVA